MAPTITTNPRLLPFRYDSMFKTFVTADQAHTSNGDVESSAGYFALVFVPAQDTPERQEMWDATFGETKGEFRDQMLELWNTLRSGWYLTREDDRGTIWVHVMHGKEEADENYEALEADYMDWRKENGLDEPEEKPDAEPEATELADAELAETGGEPRIEIVDAK